MELSAHFGGVEITFETAASVDDIFSVVDIYSYGRNIRIGSPDTANYLCTAEVKLDVIRNELWRLRDEGQRITVTIEAIPGEHKQDLIDIATLYKTSCSTATVWLHGEKVTMPETKGEIGDGLKDRIFKAFGVGQRSTFPDRLVPRSFSRPDPERDWS